MRLVLALLLAILFGSSALARQFEDANAALDRGDYATALRLIRPLADQGNVGAQYNLGGMYANGNGVPQNYAEAMKWFRLAAAQGNANAQFGLGAMYAQGQGVPQNDAEAVKWLRPAAEQGHADAQYNLGSMYANGQGVPQNYILAHMWFNLAAATGDADATKNRDRAAGEMTRQQIAEAQKLAVEWKPKTWDELKRQVPK